MDLNYGKSKMVSAIDWMPGKRGIVAAAVSASSSFDERVQVAGRPCSSHVLLWTFQDPIHPWMVLESSSDIFSLRFNPVKPHLIAGGCYNGQVILWDITKAQEKQDRKDRREAEESSEDKEKKKSVTMTPVVLFTLLSTMKTSHKAIVSDIHWLPKDFQLGVEGAQNNGETNLIASVSVDGTITFWDVTKKDEPELDESWSDERKYAAFEEKKYAWTPLYKIDVKSETPARQVGPLKMARGFKSTTYYCSTEFGQVMEVDLNMPTGAANVTGITAVHQGPVRVLLRSPFFDNVILSVGIWTFALWRDGIEKPMYVSRSSEGYLTTGCWSPTRPAVIYIGLIDGTIEVWDLLDQSHQPSMTALVSSCQLTSMEFWKLSTPQFLAVGDIQGILHIMEIPRILRRASYKEKPAMKNFFLRQQAWVVDVETRAKGRGAEIAKREAVKSAEKEREEQFFKTCTWDDQAELEYQQFEEQCRSSFQPTSVAHAA